MGSFGGLGVWGLGVECCFWEPAITALKEAKLSVFRENLRPSMPGLFNGSWDFVTRVIIKVI